MALNMYSVYWQCDYCKAVLDRDQNHNTFKQYQAQGVAAAAGWVVKSVRVGGVGSDLCPACVALDKAGQIDWQQTGG